MAGNVKFFVCIAYEKKEQLYRAVVMRRFSSSSFFFLVEDDEGSLFAQVDEKCIHQIHRKIIDYATVATFNDINTSSKSTSPF